MNVYTIHDAAAQYFLPPFFAETDNQAKRMFIGSLGDSFPHRSDFVLFQIGQFNNETGLLKENKQIESILAGASISPHLDPRVPTPENGKANVANA